MTKLERLVNTTLGMFGLQLNRRTNLQELIGFRRLISPVDNGFELIRAGSPGDGGYLVPNDFIGLSRLVSGGCDDSWTFENYFLKLSELDTVIVDRISKKPKDLNPRIKFIDAWIAGESSNSTVSIADLICDLPAAKESDLIMQLDIEGAEFMSLLALKAEELDRFRILVIEFHGLERITNREYFKHVIDPCIRKILDKFYVVHAHANNCCGVISFGQEKVPRVLELTFHNKNRSLGAQGKRNIPHHLDAPNHPAKNEINWWRPSD